MAIKNKSKVAISVVVPVFNEENNIEPFLSRCLPVLNKISKKFEIIFALDPSSDLTEDTILKFRNVDKRIKLVCLSRKFGQPAATMAGIRYSSGDRVVVIDIDLQDPPELILDLNAKMNEGFEVVYATRRSRDGETFVKKAVANLGYKLINGLSEVKIPQNTGDFRIMSRLVVNEINAMTEKHGFLRGLVAYIGFNQTAIYYDRARRYSGKGNYNKFLGSLRIGLNGLVGFSAKPLNIMSIIGATVATLSFLLGFWYFIQKLIGISLSPGLSTTIIAITFFAGVQLFSLGLLGEYISRIYDEVKDRPNYIVKQKYGFENNFNEK